MPLDPARENPYGPRSHNCARTELSVAGFRLSGDRHEEKADEEGRARMLTMGSVTFGLPPLWNPSDKDASVSLTGGPPGDDRFGEPAIGSYDPDSPAVRFARLDASDREDNLRVTALELAIKHRPGADAEEIIATADRFRAFLAGNGTDFVDGDRLTWGGYGPSGFVERIDMDATGS